MLDAVTVDFADVEVGFHGRNLGSGDAIRSAPDVWVGLWVREWVGILGFVIYLF